jgi:DNA-binding NtrC family response regulator
VFIRGKNQRYYTVYQTIKRVGILNKMVNPYRLLIIDDNKEILTALVDFLSKKKYDVVSASDGLDGLKLLETEQQGFNLVITDLVMPNISGVGLISIIKKKFPDLPVIAITGWGEHPEALATEAQANRVLEKPFDLSELDTVIKELLSP